MNALLLATAVAAPPGALPPEVVLPNPALQQGAWTHTVPVELPPAPAGMVPELAFQYDHRVADGPLGPGWRLAGGSRIDRRGPTGGTPRWSARDDFYVDGMRLWADSLLVGSYRPERDDNRHFSYSDVDNTWTAKRDGWTWTWGAFEEGGATEGRCATEYLSEDDCTVSPVGEDASALGETSTWHLSRVEDPSGNQVNYAYTADAPSAWYLSEHVLDTVSWAGGDVVATVGWEAREDIPAQARGGVLRALPWRMSGLTVTSAVGGPVITASDYRITWLDEDIDGGDACPGEVLPASAGVGWRPRAVRTTTAVPIPTRSTCTASTRTACWPPTASWRPSSPAPTRAWSSRDSSRTSTGTATSTSSCPRPRPTGAGPAGRRSGSATLRDLQRTARLGRYHRCARSLVTPWKSKKSIR